VRHTTSLGIALTSAIAAGLAPALLPADGSKEANAPRSGCFANASLEGLAVACPRGTLAELVAALHKATGLNVQYPPELGVTPVSVTLSGRSLREILQSALSAFDFVTWVVRGPPDITNLILIGVRGAADHRSRGAAMGGLATRRDRPVTSRGGALRALPPDPNLALMPSDDDAQMASVRARLAARVKPAAAALIPPGSAPLPGVAPPP
jgi:hypothetical protein